MSDDGYWCEHCKTHHPVKSMVDWCKETKGGQDSPQHHHPR